MNKRRKIIYKYTIPFLLLQSIVLFELIRVMKYDYIHDVIATSVLYLIFNILEIKFKLNLNNFIRALVTIAIISHNLFGELLGLYVTSPTYDRFQHIFGTFAFVLFSYAIINQTLGRPMYLKAREFIFIVAIGISLGATLEIVEFIVDLTTDPKVHYQLSQYDTDLDIISDIIGAFIAAFYTKTRKQFN